MVCRGFVVIAGSRLILSRLQETGAWSINPPRLFKNVDMFLWTKLLSPNIKLFPAWNKRDCGYSPSTKRSGIEFLEFNCRIGRAGEKYNSSSDLKNSLVAIDKTAPAERELQKCLIIPAENSSSTCQSIKYHVPMMNYTGHLTNAGTE